jgi:hypothetical protein
MSEDLKGAECRKGEDFVDDSQMSMKDVYRMHVLGLDSSQKVREDVFIPKNMLNFTQDSVVQNYESTILQEVNPLLSTYDRILK